MRSVNKGPRRKTRRECKDLVHGWLCEARKPVRWRDLEKRARRAHISTKSLSGALKDLIRDGFVAASAPLTEKRMTIHYVAEPEEMVELRRRVGEDVESLSTWIDRELSKTGISDRVRALKLAEGITAFLRAHSEYTLHAVKFSHAAGDLEKLDSRLSFLAYIYLDQFLKGAARACFRHRDVAPQALEIMERSIASSKTHGTRAHRAGRR